ncbi:hypothetical protein [Bacteroides ilei]|jgi:hypothetical protein|uniref:DUF6965 family protein n=1 Tax=Bacteroides ilei TaxID=1907658 RepID=UPI000930D4BA|nr:hypothetical protein [Bacteroides ilei]
MENRNVCTKEELQALKEWFDAASLPESLKVDKAVSIPHLKETVERLFDQAEVCYENPKMQGCIILLENIKARLESLQG